jgi:hypothetical protein
MYSQLLSKVFLRCSPECDRLRSATESTPPKVASFAALHDAGSSFFLELVLVSG